MESCRFVYIDTGSLLGFSNKFDLWLPEIQALSCTVYFHSSHLKKCTICRENKGEKDVISAHFFSIRPFQITLDQSTYYEGSQKLITNQHQCFTNIKVRDLDPQQNLMLFFFPLVTLFFSPEAPALHRVS